MTVRHGTADQLTLIVEICAPRPAMPRPSTVQMTFLPVADNAAAPLLGTSWRWCPVAQLSTLQLVHRPVAGWTTVLSGPWRQTATAASSRGHPLGTRCTCQLSPLSACDVMVNTGSPTGVTLRHQLPSHHATCDSRVYLMFKFYFRHNFTQFVKYKDLQFVRFWTKKKYKITSNGH